MNGTVRVLSDPMLAPGAIEGYVTVTAGLNAETQVRIGELPGGLFIDFKD